MRSMRPAAPPAATLAVLASAFALAFVLAFTFHLPIRAAAAAADTRPSAPDADRALRVTETDDEVRIETDALSAVVRKQGYVSGIAAGSLLDKKTGAHDLGFGLHVMDFLLAPGWRDDGYERDRQAPRRPAQALRRRAADLHAGQAVARGGDRAATASSPCAAALHLHPARRRLQGRLHLGADPRLPARCALRPRRAERITSANDVDDLFYRLDMPGHIRHGRKDARGGQGGKAGQGGEPVPPDLPELSGEGSGGRKEGKEGKEGGSGEGTSTGTFIPASEFDEDFAPDAKFLYRRNDAAVPQRMIRAVPGEPRRRPRAARRERPLAGRA